MDMDTLAWVEEAEAALVGQETVEHKHEAADSRLQVANFSLHGKNPSGAKPQLGDECRLKAASVAHGRANSSVIPQFSYYASQPVVRDSMYVYNNHK